MHYIKFYFTSCFLGIATAQLRSIEACNKGHTCTPFSKCDLKNLDAAVLFPCTGGICCPVTVSLNANENFDPSDVFPKNCGVATSDNKVSGGENATLGQFPWMALLGYKPKSIDIVQFFCAGSIITDSYILTAAHCLQLDDTFELKFVRVGELNLQTKVDCEHFETETLCGDPYVDIPVRRAIIHEKYQRKTLKNDIALIHLAEKIKFTDYVQPICLPFTKKMQNVHPNQKLIVSGWGKTNPTNLGGATHLQFATIKVWDQNICNLSVSPDVKPIDDRQICANGPENSDACKGDSGGPLFNATVDDGEVRSYQVGIVSFGATQKSCGNPELPTVFTRVDRYLGWIRQNVLVDRE